MKKIDYTIGSIKSDGICSCLNFQKSNNVDEKERTEQKYDMACIQ